MSRRLGTRVFGLCIFLAYTVLAIASALALVWILTNPPSIGVVLVGAIGGLFLGSYVAYRIGTHRLVARLHVRELLRHDEPELYDRLERLSTEMDIRQPALLIADLGAPNALSLGGPRKGAVIIDTQLFRLLSIDEFEGILAHELAHIERHDTLLNTLAISTIRLLGGVVLLFLLPILLFLTGLDRAGMWLSGAPQDGEHVRFARSFRRSVLLALSGVLSVFTLVYLAHARRQEYAADRRAVELTGKPWALARALRKIHRANDPRSGLLSLLYIHDERTQRDSVLSTHPPLERRLEQLRELETSMSSTVS